MLEPPYSDTSDNSIEFLKVPPFSIEAEQSVLGGLMLNNEAWFSIADLINEHDFYRPEHQLIFSAIKSLSEESRPCDVVTLSERLEQDDKWLPYLGQLAKNTPSAANIVAYAEIVRERSVLRQVVRVGQEIAGSAFNLQGRNSAELLDHAEKLVFEIAEQGLRKKAGFVPLKKLCSKMIEHIEFLSQQEEPLTGVSTGFKDFDDFTSGLQNSDLIIIAGRPSMGKCITGDSKIILSDGSLVTIEEIYHRRQAQLLTLNPNGKFHFTQPTAFIDNGEQPVFGVTTKLGRYIETTFQHPYLTPTGWKPLAQISVGEKIAVPSILNCFGTITLSDGEVKLLSYWTAGRYDYFNSWHGRFKNLPVALRADIKEAILQIESNSGKTRHRLAVTLPQESNFTRRTIPALVFQLSRPQLALFLNRLFATNNDINVTLKGNGSIRYNHVNESLVKGVQHLLLRFGLLSTLQRSRRATQITWYLKIAEPRSVLTFIDQIGIFTKQSILAKWRAILSRVTEPELAVTTTSRLTLNESNESLVDNPPTAIRANSDNLGQTFANTESEIYWDKILSIEYQGRKQVYDLTIPDTHNFVANDICVHNTSFAMNIAEHVAVDKKLPVAVFSMEMSNEQLMLRILSSIAKVELQKIRTGKLLNDDDWASITRNLHRLEEAPLFIDETPALNPTELRLRSRRFVREQGRVGLIVIDYLQLMQIPETKESRANEVSEISRSLKSLAKELNVPVIALSQLNRGLEQRPDKRPRMSDLRESGCLAGDSLVHRADTGECIPIRELVGLSNFSVWAVNTHTRQLETATVSRVFSTGIKPVFRLITQWGRTLCATSNHRFYTPLGWKRLDQLTPKDYLAVPRHNSDLELDLTTFRKLSNLSTHGGLDLDLDLTTFRKLSNLKLSNLSTTEIEWDRVATIKFAEETEVFDLTVPSLHSFVANDITVHNSLEQDADLVVFIYRDEVYDPDSTEKGVAEINIAKQRNGPIGKFKLTFNGRITKFENYVADGYYGE